jgi:hypothetical protein
MKRLVLVLVIALALIPALFSCSQNSPGGPPRLEADFNFDGYLTTDMTAEDLRPYFEVKYFSSSDAEAKTLSSTQYEIECDVREGECPVYVSYKRTNFVFKLFFYDSAKISQEGDFAFYRGYNGNNYLLKYTGSAQNVVLPEGEPYRISDEAFAKNAYIKTVDLGDSVTRIGAGAFSGCSSLERVDIGAGLSEVCVGAFTTCRALRVVSTDTLEKWFEIEYNILNAMYEKSDNIGFGGFEAVFIEDDILEILQNGGELVTIGDEIYVAYGEDEQELVGFVSVSNPIFYTNRVFVDGIEVKDIVVPETVTKIHAYAFAYSYIEHLTLHHSVTEVGENAFLYCPSRDLHYDGGEDWYYQKAGKAVYFTPDYITWQQEEDGIYELRWYKA